MDTTDTITVNIQLERKVNASRADMYVEIRGDSFFSGSTALKKAREVRDLVETLMQVGIDERMIQVAGIRAEVSSGIIRKSSSAIYRLRIEVPSLEMLADVLGAVTSRKNARLTLLDWQYDSDDALHDNMLRQALGMAQNRAHLICRELSHRNLGVHSLTEKLKDNQEKSPNIFDGAQFRAAFSTLKLRSSAITKEDMGLEVSHTKTVSLNVCVEYRVEPEAVAERAED